MMRLFVLAIAAGLGARAAAQDMSADPRAADPRPAAAVVALESVARPFEDRIVLRGRTEADRRVEVRAEISGLVASAPIRKGARVAAGDPLCVLDPGERPANLAEANAYLRQMEVEHQAALTLSQKGFTAETESLTRAAKLEGARALLMRAELDMRRLILAAPFDGMLESDTAELGALLQPGAVCATLIALDPILLVGYAAERDVDKLTVGAPAHARLANGRAVEGAIRFVSRAADEATRTFRVEVAAANPALDIRDGMTAEIMVALSAAPAHLVPQSALTLDDAGRLGVRLADGGAARFVPVTIMGEAAGGVWLDGLPPRATIIVVGQEFVSDGHPLTVTLTDKNAALR